jgi:hypothetical protein
MSWNGRNDAQRDPPTTHGGIEMNPALGPEDKLTPLMLYTTSGMVRAEVISKQSVRVSIWLRSDSAPRYLHLIKVQVVLVDGSAIKTFSHSDVFLPTETVVAYHLLPPASEPMDYDDTEANRRMQPATALLNGFQFKGHLRISTQSDLGTTIEMAHTSWLSFYDVDVANTYLPQLAIRAPMMLINPSRVGFAVE